MSDIFDLSKVSHSVDTLRPSRVLILDTNIVMDNPDPSDWRVEPGGQNLFVLSDTLFQELEHISSKEGTKERVASRDKAKVAIEGMAKLFSLGTITEGIPIRHGWAIGVPSPRKDILDPELEQLQDLVTAFKRSDAKLLLLTKECHQLVRSIPVTLVTHDANFSNVVQMQGVPCHLCEYFPIQGLKEAPATAKELDWDQVLTNIASDIQDRAIHVEVTLTARGLAPSWLKPGDRSFMVAEGHGVVRTGAEIRTFLWTLPYYPLRLQPPSGDAGTGSAELPLIHMDFLGEDDLAQDLFDAIADRLSACEDLLPDEHGPTVHSPRSVMEMLAFLEYISTEGPSHNALSDVMQEIASAGGLADYWTDRLRTMGGTNERYACLQTLMEALDNCWEIGETHTFSIVMRQ